MFGYIQNDYGFFFTFNDMQCSVYKIAILVDMDLQSLKILAKEKFNISIDMELYDIYSFNLDSTQRLVDYLNSLLLMNKLDDKKKITNDIRDTLLYHQYYGLGLIKIKNPIICLPNA